MATEKPRFSVTFSDESFEKIQKYKKENSISTQSKAVAQLVELAINKMEESGKTRKAPSISDGAMKLAKDYDTLDRWGKQAVRELVDTELARMEDESRFLEATTMEPEPKVINLFLEPAAAGIAAPTMGRDYELYELGADDPQGAAYAVRIQGDSMAPYFPDGSTVFVNHDAVADGDIGIFCVDGGTVCKQYHRQGGIVYLFSLNRQRQDSDVVVFPNSNQSLVCQGRVMTKRRFPVPGM